MKGKIKNTAQTLIKLPFFQRPSSLEWAVTAGFWIGAFVPVVGAFWL